jgi:peptide subunit release factor 1 (eRF1)
MLNTKHVQNFSQLPAPLLTLYLNTKSGEPSKHPVIPAHLKWLKKEAKVLCRQLPPAERAAFRRELRRVETFFHGRHPREKSLVIFAGQGTWQEIPLQIEVENELRWGKPVISQLLWLFDEHQPYCIVVVDRTGARFFRYQLRELLELEDKKFVIDISQWKKKELGHVTGQTVRKTRGSQRDTFQRRMDAQFARLFSDVADRTAAFCRQENPAGIFLVGSSEFAVSVEKRIPQEFRDLVAVINQDFGKLSSTQVRQRLETMLTEWEGHSKLTKIEGLLASERGTVTGIDETLALLQEGMIRTLVLARDLNTSLHRCVNCGHIDRSADPVCSSCKAAREPVSLKDVLPNLAESGKAAIEVVSGEAAAKLREVGGIAGWVRQAALATAQ